MPDIYDQHEAAFRNVSAFVVLDGSKRAATVALKYPRDGAGKLYAYVQWFGLAMVRGYASGYGYDKGSAAVANALDNLPKLPRDLEENPNRYLDFRDSCKGHDGYDWTRNFEKAGFRVLQAV